MGAKNSQTTTSGLDWNAMIGLLHRLKKDGHYRDYLFISCGCYFGLRASDLLSLKWSDVSADFQVSDGFHIEERKTGKRRHITINPSVKESLELVKAHLIKSGKFGGEAYLFPNRWGNPLTISYVNKRLHFLFAKYQVKAQNPSTHTLRKTFGKRVWEMDSRSERSLVYLSEIFGHSSTAITRKYIGITQQVIADVYMNL